MGTTNSNDPATDEWFLNVVLLRSGALLEADEIAEQPDERRPLSMAMIFVRASQLDPAIGAGLVSRGILPKLQHDTLIRSQAAKVRAS